MIAERIRVLVLVANCHPDLGSEPGVGWTWIKALQQHCEIEVLCGFYRDNKAAIEREQAKDPEGIGRVRFHYIPWFHPEGMMEHFLWKYYQPYYYRRYNQWMKCARDVARDLVVSGRFDVCHQLTMIGYREPGYLWSMKRPFVWGPVGGTQDVPWRFLPSLGWEWGLKNLFRNVINHFQFRYSLRLKKVLRHTNALLSVASDTARLFKVVHGRDSVVVQVSPTVAPHPLGRVRQPSAELRIVFSGLAIGRKNLPLLLQALADPVLPNNWRLDVLGDGPQTRAWALKAKSLGIADRTIWHGRLPRDEALKCMAECDFMAFPSLQEGSPGVVSEALSLGLPVICFDLHGQHDMVDTTCGVAIKAASHRQAVRDFTTAINDLLRNPRRVSELSAGALERAGKFTADVQCAKFLEAYEEAIRAYQTGHSA